MFTSADNMLPRREATLFLVGSGLLIFFLGTYNYSKVKSLMMNVDHKKLTDPEVEHIQEHIGPTVRAEFRNDVISSARGSRKSGTPQQNPTKWTRPVVPEHLQSVDQENEELIQHIRDHWIKPPFPPGQQVLYNQTKVHYSQIGQSKVIDRWLKQRDGGFFIECGAGDGQFLSNTLFFEKYRRWTGLLVEVDPDWFSKMLSVRRHSYMINACLSPTGKPVVLNYTSAMLLGGLDQYMEHSHRKNIVEKKYISGKLTVQCFPLLSILKAIGIEHVDYFSLDVEGPELDILKTVPFDRVDVETMTIEYRVNGDSEQTKRKLSGIRDLLVKKYNYKEIMLLRGLDIVLTKSKSVNERTD